MMGILAARVRDLDVNFALCLVLALGLFLRAIWALIVPVEPVSDSNAYLIYAQNLFHHGVYGLTPEEPGAYWPVGTSAIAAATFLVFGEGFGGVVAMNIAATAIIIYATYRIGVLWFGRAAAFVAAGLIAFWPNLILFTTVLSSELYFIAMVMAGLLFWERRDRALPLVACAMCWGLACYLRPVALLLPVALFASAFPHSLRSTLATMLQTSVIVAIMLMTVLPWSWRNYQVFREPVLVSTNFGPNLWMGNNPESTGGYMPLPEWVAQMSETERAKVLEDAAKSYIASDPLGFAVRTAKKAVKLFERETIGVGWNAAAIERLAGGTGLLLAKLVATGYWYGLLFLATIGLLQLARNMGWRMLFHPAVLSVAYFTGIHAIVVAEDRYHMPVSGVIALLAGVGVVKLNQLRVAIP
jgi:4-amino-4-deoxy-L-arabinose transferase-like glycosyltransferase